MADGSVNSSEKVDENTYSWARKYFDVQNRNVKDGKGNVVSQLSDVCKLPMRRKPDVISEDSSLYNI